MGNKKKDTIKAALSRHLLLSRHFTNLRIPKCPVFHVLLHVVSDWLAPACVK
jgi:hypothetical protein